MGIEYGQIVLSAVCWDGTRNPGVEAMVRKRAPKVPAIQEPKAQMAVRLELPIEDYRRLEHQARKLGLTKASYARMAVMKTITADEEGGK
jgi:hypothetical protein